VSQNEPYVVLTRTASGVKSGRNFATLKAARIHLRRTGANTIAQKRRGHAGLTIVERYRDGKRVA